MGIDKVYILQKDLPYVKSGAHFSQRDIETYYTNYPILEYPIKKDTYTFEKEFVENNPDWFKEKKLRPAFAVVTDKLFYTQGEVDDFDDWTKLAVPIWRFCRENKYSLCELLNLTKNINLKEVKDIHARIHKLLIDKIK